MDVDLVANAIYVLTSIEGSARSLQMRLPQAFNACPAALASTSPLGISIAGSWSSCAVHQSWSFPLSAAVHDLKTRRGLGLFTAGLTGLPAAVEDRQETFSGSLVLSAIIACGWFLLFSFPSFFDRNSHNMAKRKRQSVPEVVSTAKSEAPKKVKFNGSEKPAKPQEPTKATATPKSTQANDTEATASARSDSAITIQIIAGSYDRVLHGVTATIQPSSSSNDLNNNSREVKFADTFLFSAHTSAVRCLALSPPSAPVPGQSQKVMLATGSTDERVNVYNLSAHPPSTKTNPDAELLSSIAKRSIRENSRNRELGTLLHHASTVTSLAFPTRSKLLSSSEDSTIAVTRTRDWSLLSTIKAPVPTVYGRPSGDTAPLGGTPSGVNDFAVHPSMKVMISVSKGERCMRLWNLVTGKKAGVLDFGRAVLREIGEARHSTGEGRKVIWGSSEDEGDEFAVGFERDVLVFGMDSKVRCRVMPEGVRTKVHESVYIKLGPETEASVLALSTEDGRIMFFSTATKDLDKEQKHDDSPSLPRAKLFAQVGGKDEGVIGRLKDFKILQAEGAPGVWFVVAASSDGKLRVWELSQEHLGPKKKGEETAKPAGTLLGTYETQNRITCVEAFVMIPRPDGVEESEEEREEEDSEDESSGEDE